MARAFAILGAVYLATFTPGIGWWDAGEFVAAAATWGIPHPPATPLYVAALRAVGVPLSALGLSWGTATTLVSIASGAGAGALLARLTRSPAAGVAGGLTATVWTSATETEVYLPALLVALLAVDAAVRGRAALAVYWLALGWALHPIVLVAAPACGAGVAVAAGAARGRDGRAEGAPRALRGARAWGAAAAMAGAAALGASAAVITLLRARHAPWLAIGDPSTVDAWLAVLRRAQYGEVPLWPRRAPVAAQLAQVGMVLDWQFALGLTRDTAFAWWRTLCAVAGVALAVRGAGALWRRDRPAAAALGTLLVSGTVGVAFVLNLPPAPEFAPVAWLTGGHEPDVRTRDYFFVFGCAALGALAALGVRGARGWIVAAALLVANWRAPARLSYPERGLAEPFAREVLTTAPPDAVIAGLGDNGIYPLWAVNRTAQLRPDVSVIAVPLLGLPWYRAQVARRYGLHAQDLPELEAAAARAGQPMVRLDGERFRRELASLRARATLRAPPR